MHAIPKNNCDGDCQFHDSSIGNWCCFSKSRLQAQTAIFAFLTFIELDKFIRPKKCKRYVNILSELFFSDVSSLSRSSERMEHVAVKTEVPEYLCENAYTLEVNRPCEIFEQEKYQGSKVTGHLLCYLPFISTSLLTRSCPRSFKRKKNKKARTAHQAMMTTKPSTFQPNKRNEWLSLA